MKGTELDILNWQNKYSVGNSILDTQHKHLISLINKLNLAMYDTSDDLTPQNLLDELVLYAIDHFKTEEEILSRISYDGYQAHKNEHEAFKKKLIKLQSSYLFDKRPTIAEVSKLLKNWFHDHLSGSDQKFVEQLSKSAVAVSPEGKI